MSTVPFTMQLRSATARQSQKLVHHYEHINTNGRRALKVHFNNAPGNPKTLTFIHQPRSGLKLRLGKVTTRTTEATKLVHHHEHMTLHNRRALRVHMNSGQGNPRTLTFFHQPRSGTRLRFGRRPHLDTSLTRRLSRGQTRFIRDWVYRHTCSSFADDAVVSTKADLLIAAAEDQQMDGGEIKV